MRTQFQVNGRTVTVDIPLLWIIRDEIGPKGTTFGCGIGMCGTAQMRDVVASAPESQNVGRISWEAPA